MTDVELRLINRAVRDLNALGAKYKIILADSEYGELEVLKKSDRVQHGTYSDVYRPLLPEDLAVGEVVVIPGGDNPEGMRSAMSGYACRVFGNGNYITSVAGGNIEFMRLE